MARLFAVLALAMIACIPLSWLEGDGRGDQALAASATLAFAAAWIAYYAGRGADPTLRVRDAVFFVTVGWFAAGVLGALPYFLSGSVHDFHDAFFETVSGFTTTGSTILRDIPSLPAGLHAWRMTTHWLGGIGIVVIFVALFPQLGVGAKHLFKSEVPGPITEGLRPKIKNTALALFWIYVGLTAAEGVLLWIADMSPFEAILHAFSTMATGGFSTRAGSVGEFGSPAIEWIISLFMYLAGVNFALYFGALSGRLRDVFRDFEWRTYTLLVGAVALAVAVWILPLHGDAETALRKATFQTLAIATTTGFGTDDFDVYPPLCKVLIVGLMFVGASAGSTAGGMKVSRVIIMFKALVGELAHVVRPHTVTAVKLGRTVVRADVIKQVFAFSLMYAFTAFVGAAWVAGLGVDFVTAMSAALTCTANVGPGFAGVGPNLNFADIPVSGKYVLTVCMILGRLEFYTVVALLLPSAWRR